MAVINSSCVEINNCMQNFTGRHYETSEQHKEATLARLQRDLKDAAKMLEYVIPRNPFAVNKELINLHTGVVAEKMSMLTIHLK